MKVKQSAGKKLLFVVAGIVVLAVILAVAFFSAARTPEDAVRRYAAQLNPPSTAFQMGEVVAQVDAGDYRLVFYYSQSGGLSCAATEKGPLGWRVAKLAGELATESETLRAGLIWSRITKDEAWFYYGILYDETVARVNFYGADASLLPLENGLVLCYYVGFGGDEIENGNYLLYDAPGNELSHWIETEEGT